ncbi:MAG: ThiF family adenylyltransferase [Deltaproteobacteria bacterium]|nr:ThiF family adenylyltransferase [Deltaproteobacteria bacterium]
MDREALKLIKKFSRISPVAAGQEMSVIGLQDALSVAQSCQKHLGEVYRIALAHQICPLCYIRNFATFTIEEQLLLAKSHLHIAGAGGLGGALVMLLARLGIGKITIIDYDIFEESNLNRQLFSRYATLGKSKVAVVAHDVERINPAVEIIAIQRKILPESVDDLFSKAAMIIDGMDNIETRRCIAKYASAQGIPFIHGAAGGWVGQVACFLPDGKNAFSSLYPNETIELRRRDVPACSPVLVASLQVVAAIKILLGKPQDDSLLHVDLARNLFKQIEI